MRIGFFGDSLTEGRPGVSYVDILRGQLPADELLNFGRGGDSVIGTYERVSSLDGRGPFDLAFVWTGVNDVLAHISWASPITRRLLGEPWASSRQEFIEQYRMLLKVLSKNATRIVAVAPLFIGEDLSNPWNQELDVLASEMEALCARFDRVEFLNLRPYMTDVASGECCVALRGEERARHGVGGGRPARSRTRRPRGRRARPLLHRRRDSPQQPRGEGSCRGICR